MFREKISAPQLGAWLFAAMVPVGLQLLGSTPWIWVAGSGLFSLLLASSLWRSPREVSRLESGLLFIYVSVLMGQLLHETAQSWPVGNSDPAVPLILLGLAAWSAQKGPGAAARVGAVLFWVVLGLYLAVFAAGVKDVKLSWLKPDLYEPDWLGLTVFLLPWAGSGLLKTRGTPGRHGWLTVAFVLAGTLITAGVLSPAMAVGSANAFYDMSRSLDLLGVARRFEALICAGATVGWFALLSIFLTLCGSYAQKVFPGRGRAGVWAAAGAAAGWKLCGLHINPIYLLLAGTVFWVVVPLLAQGLGKIKKS